MAKILALISALEGVEAHKALAAEARAQFGSLLELEVLDAVARVEKGDAAVAQIVDLSKQVKDLDEKAKGADTLRATLDGYEARERTNLIGKEIGAKAKEFGIRPEAVPTVLKLVDLSGIKVDAAKGVVTGLSKELFEAVKKEHPTVAEPAAAAATVTPPPPANGAATAQATPTIPGPVGAFMAAIKS